MKSNYMIVMNPQRVKSIRIIFNLYNGNYISHACEVSLIYINFVYTLLAMNTYTLDTNFQYHTFNCTVTIYCLLFSEPQEGIL